MHRCLQIPELLEIICEAIIDSRLLVQGRVTRDRRSLSSFLKTCQTFSRPATKVLWRRLNSLEPLILTMPDDLLQITPGLHKKITFKRGIQQHDWTRFDLYASFVRRLTADVQSYTILLDETIYSELRRRNNLPLPNLQSLVISKTLIPIIPCLLKTASLRQIEFQALALQREDIRSTLAQIPTCTPNLKSLLFKTWPALGSDYEVDSNLDVLLRTADLEKLDWTWFDLKNTHIQHLLQMPSLREAKFSKNIPDLFNELQKHPVRDDLSLRSIAIFTGDMGPTYLPGIISSLRPSKLESFSVCTTFRRSTACNSETLSNLFRTISASFSPAYFNSLGIDGRDDDAWDSNVISLSTIRPFLSFSGLRFLSLKPYTLEMVDDEVKELAMAWPNLEMFSITPPLPTSNFMTRVTVKCLVWFATYCPRLTRLAIYFEGGYISEGDLERSLNHRLRTLDVGSSTVGDSDALETAAFIKGLFPSAYLSWTEVSTWQKVNNILMESNKQDYDSSDDYVDDSD